MRNRVPSPGKEGRMLITPENGSAPFYATVTMADEPLEDGTPFAMETMLTDETAKAIWLENVNKTPNEAFAKIAPFFQHWWQVVSGDALSYVQSLYRNAYPDFGEVDGTSYQYLGVPLDKSVKSLSVEFGRYTGTGTSGPSNPNSITFNGKPLILHIHDTTATHLAGLIFPTQSHGLCAIQNSFSRLLSVALEGNTVYWYASGTDASTQLNYLNNVYEYFAICL